MSAYDQACTILQRTDARAPLRPQPTNDWTGEYPLLPAVVAYYLELGPHD